MNEVDEIQGVEPSLFSEDKASSKQTKYMDEKSIQTRKALQELNNSYQYATCFTSSFMSYVSHVEKPNTNLTQAILVDLTKEYLNQIELVMDQLYTDLSRKLKLTKHDLSALHLNELFRKKGG